MENREATEPKKLSLKKQVNFDVIQTLTAGLPHLKEILGGKKFENRVEKAAKLLSAGVKEKQKKRNQDAPGKKSKRTP